MSFHRFGWLFAAMLLVACGKKSGDEAATEKTATAKSEGKKAADKEASPERKAALAEARRQLGSIETGSKNAYQMETDESGAGTGPYVHRFCASTKPVPAKAPAGKLYESSEKEWDEDGWRCLKFIITGTQRCQYAYESNGKIGVDAKYTATATCDPDGDGKLLTVVLKGKGSDNGDAERVSLEVTGGP